MLNKTYFLNFSKFDYPRFLFSIDVLGGYGVRKHVILLK